MKGIKAFYQVLKLSAGLFWVLLVFTSLRTSDIELLHNTTSFKFDSDDETIDSVDKDDDEIVFNYREDGTLKGVYHYDRGSLTTFIRYDTRGRLTERGQYEQALRPDTIEVVDGQTFESSIVVTGDSSMTDVKTGLWEKYFSMDEVVDSIAFYYYERGILKEVKVHVVE